jgi:ribosome-associated protein
LSTTITKLSPIFQRESEHLNIEIIESIKDLKGKDIVKMDLRHLHDAPADFFIICEGTSNTQVRAIAEHINQHVRKTLTIKPNHIEGEKSGLWICVDYFNTVVHVFHPDMRKYYAIEDLWSDARTVVYENM